MRYNYNFQKLRGRITEYYGNIGNFAKELDLSRASLSLKLNNKVKFSYDEVVTIIDKLHISPEEIKDIFFSIKS